MKRKQNAREAASDAGAGVSQRRQRRFICPADSCNGDFCSHRGLHLHWQYKHENILGAMRAYTPMGERRGCGDSAVAGPSSDASAPVDKESLPDIVSTAMENIDNMTFRYAETNAEVTRAKQMTAACLQALKPSIRAALAPHVYDGVEVGELVDPLLDVFERITSRMGERRERNARTSSTHPPLQLHKRLLGERPALLGKRKCIEGALAYAWDSRLEELLEREVVYDPSFLTQLILSDQYWRARTRELKNSDPRDPNRTFEDQVDGEVWQSHEVLGDPNYNGPVSVCGQGYCDDVDVPNGIGPAAGHSKLYIQTVTIVNRPVRGRMTLRAQFLSTVCLSSDFSKFGARAVISGQGTLESSLGATCRRLWTRGWLRIPPSQGIEQLEFRFFLTVWQADGLAMGDVCGTNTSFSKAVNICCSCENIDQRTDASRTPCSLLRCECCDADVHKPGCPCHFRLRTATRDRARNRDNPTPSADEMRALGIKTLSHGLFGVPGIHVATAGPKDAMHTLNEGRTSQLGAMTLWAVVNAGWATKEQLKVHASTFDWTPGSPTTGYYCPNYLPNTIFVSTKVPQAGRSWVWGPHKGIKIPGSAAGVTTYTIMSLEFLRPFIPQGPLPVWWRIWQQHRAGFCMGLRYRFTLRDLYQMEDHFVESETLIQSHPPYRSCWIPKAHWVLHLAHDIFRFGPSRLLTTLLNEMKNAKFKAGAKRSNFHNPPKSVAEFWAGQSDWELQNLPHSAACSCAVSLVSGRADVFHDSVAVALLLSQSRIKPSTHVDFLSSVKLHSVTVQRTDYVFLDRCVYTVARLVSACEQFYAVLHEVASLVLTDELGAYYFEHVASVEEDLPTRMITLDNACTMTALWSIPVDSRVYFVPKY